jgi:hypothetical protein
MSLGCFWKSPRAQKTNEMSPSAVPNGIDAENASKLIPKGVEDAKGASVTVNDINITKTPSEVPIVADVSNCAPVISSGINGTDKCASFSYPESETQDPYQIVSQYHSRPSKLRIAGIGAGASGMYSQTLKPVCR